MACSGPAVDKQPKQPDFPVSQYYLQDHPSRIFMQAADLLEAGEMEQAAQWFYAGQLRYRVWLDCPALKPSAQDLIVFSAQFEIMEPQINRWAAQNLDTFSALLDDVLIWDEKNIEQPPAYADCLEARQKVRNVYRDIQKQAHMAGDGG